MHFFKYLISVLCGMSAALFFIAGAILPVSAETAEKEVVVAVPTDRTPMFYQDGDSDEIIGIGADLLKVAAKEAGFSVALTEFKEKDLKAALDNEDYDLVLPFGSAIKSAGGKDTVISDNLIQTPFTLVSESDKELPAIETIRVGMLRSLGAGAETVKTLYPDMEIRLYDTMDDCVKALHDNEVDALLHNSYVWSYILQKPAYSHLTVRPSDMFTMDFRAGAVDTPEAQALIRDLNKGIAATPETKRQAIVLDYTSRRLYHYDLSDFLYRYGLILSVALFLAIVEFIRTRELTKAKKAAEEGSRAKSQFLASMSHEIRTPINSIMGMGELISREATDPKIRKYAHIINSSSNSLLMLVNDILDFARMEAGKLTLRNDPYRLCNLLHDVDLMIRGRAESKGLDFRMNVNSAIPNELIGDEIRLKQVIINLLTNGVKYTVSGSVELCIDFGDAGDGYVNLLIMVKDTGIGLKQEEINRLFQAFERLDEDRNRTVEGTGLGMSIVKQILDAMDSTLSIHSVYGSGSDFSFILRQKVSDWKNLGDCQAEMERGSDGHKAYRPAFIAPDVRILAVDDTELNLMVLSGLLEKTRIQLDTALSGEAALKMIRRTEYDILLIDHRMPNMDGIQLLKHIRIDEDHKNKDSVCIALTANVVEGEREMCLDAGFDDYLEKPVTGSRLETMLLRYLPAEKILANTDPDDNAGIHGELTRLAETGLLDTSEGISYAGTEELYLKTLRYFRDSVEEKANEIRELLDADRIDDYMIKVHAVKSTAKIIGAFELSQKARELEMAAKDENRAFLREHTGEMLELYREYPGHLADL